MHSYSSKLRLFFCIIIMLCSFCPFNSVQVPAKAQGNMLPRRIPVSSNSVSQEGLSDLISDPPSRGNNSLNSNEGNTSISVSYISKLLLRYSGYWVVIKVINLLSSNKYCIV